MPLTHREIELSYREGRKLFRSWSKSPSQTTASGIWFDLSMSPGNPVAQYYFATPMTATAMARSTDGGLDHGGNVNSVGYKKFLHRFEIQTVGATAAPLTFELLDYLAFYPGIAMDVGVQEFSTAISLPRWTAADGVQMMVIEQNPYVGGATFAITYENAAGDTVVSPTLTCNTQVSAGTIATTASATAGCLGRFVPLASQDKGVARPLSIEFFTGDVGLLCVVLVKPLAHGNIFETTAPCYYEFPRDFADLPEIKDDAYLNLICMPVGTLAGSTILGNLTTIWSA